MGNRFYPNRFSRLDEEPGWHFFGAMNGLLLFLVGCFFLASDCEWQALVYSHELALNFFVTIGGLLIFTIDMVRFFRLRKRGRTSSK